MTYEEMLELHEEFLAEENITNDDLRESLLMMAKHGELRPSEKTPLGRALILFTTEPPDEE